MTIGRQGTPTWVWWTAGKDAAWALYELRSDPAWDVLGLIAPVDHFDGRAAGLGVRRELLEEQALAAGLPIQIVGCSARGGSFSICDADLSRAFSGLRVQGVRAVAFADLYPRLEQRPILQLADTGLEATFPLARRDPWRLARAMLVAGVAARVYAVEKAVVPKSLLGCHFDGSFLADLPPQVDPCGQEREFQTFAEWAPGWSRRVGVEPGRSTECHGYAFADLESTEAAPRTGVGPWGTATSPDGPYDPFHYFERLARVRHHVDEHIGEDLTLDSVAVVAALAPSSFGRYFRQRVGMTFRSWLARHRVDSACRMLRESDVPVARVARAVGFQRDRSFRRAFRATVGCSPSEYRKRLIPGASVDARPDT